MKTVGVCTVSRTTATAAAIVVVVGEKGERRRPGRVSTEESSFGGEEGVAELLFRRVSPRFADSAFQ